MAVQDEVRRAQAPYLPWSTFRAFFENVNPLPNRIDGSVLRYTSGTNQQLLRHALRTLDLTAADGAVTPKMTAVAQAINGTDRKALQSLLREAYPALFAPPFDLLTATPAQLREQFEGLGFTGSTARKSQAFFLAAAEYAGIEFSPHLRGGGGVPTRRPSVPRTRRTPRVVSNGGNGGGEASRRDEPRAPSLTGLPPALAGILQFLPNQGEKWTRARRDKFIKTFEGTLDLCFEVSDPERIE